MLELNVNSWVTVAEADAYLLDKFGAGAWSPLSNTTKEQLLVTAFRWIFSHPDYSIPKTSTVELVKNAQIELAWWTYKYIEEFDDRGALIASGTQEFLLREWEEKLSDKQTLPLIVKNMLVAEAVNSGGYFPVFSRDIDA